MPIFRFCRIIEDRGRQYLVRAANNTYLVGRGEEPGPATALTVDTWIVTAEGMAEGYDWDNMRVVLPMPSHVALLQALECFTKDHAREAYYLVAAAHAKQLTMEEQLAGQKQLTFSVGVAVIQRYGSIG